MSSKVGKAASLAFVAAVIVLWAFTLRPQALGGPAVFVAVRGSSMVPTYEHGDLVVVQSAAAYKVGDVVAYRVPAGEIGAGKIVIHRIVDGDASQGFTLQGDHNSAPDPWHPKQADMVGIATFRLSGAGRLIALVQQPVILAGLASSIVIMVLLARPAGPTVRTRRVRRRLAG
jgi:signal peptidase I